MGIQIGGLVVMALLIVVLALMSQASIISGLMASRAATQTIDSTGDRARTNLEFVSAVAAVGNLTVELKNTGFTSVFDFSEMDFIVEYLDSSDNQVITRLTYTTGALANNEWKKTSIAPDGYQPNAWDPSENLTLDALLSPAQKAGTSATTTVVTPNGVAVVWSFGADGFFWFTNAIDISLAATAAWQDKWQTIDLSAYVPTGTTGAVVQVVNTIATDDLSGVVRGTEDDRNYMSNTDFEAMKKESSRWQIVKVDSNRRIQGYIETTDIDFKLQGYTLGSDPSFFADPPDITPATTGQWVTVDVSAANVDADADGVILLVDSENGGIKKYGIRETGSSFPDPKNKLSKYANTMYLVGITASAKFDVWIEELDIKIYLVGQTKGSVVYNLEDVAVADPIAGSWQEIDADEYRVPAEANGVFLRVEKETKAGFRHADSGDSWTGQLEKDTYLLAGIGLRSDNVWEEYLEDIGKLDVFIVAYTLPVTN